MFVEEGKKLFSYVGADFFIEKGIEPNNLFFDLFFNGFSSVLV